MSDSWNPAQYHKVKAQRAAPFFDLIALIRRQLSRVRAIDLGCGTGELTAVLAERLDADVLGVDSSAKMLSTAAEHAGLHVRFVERDIAAVDDYRGYDLVFSNAALHWVPDHERLLPKILDALAPGAQIAVQMPNNFGHPSHRIAAELAQEHGLGAASRYVLPLERYAEILHAHGFTDQICFEKIYGHALDRTDDVVEWTKGTTLTAYLPRLDDKAQAAFLTEYRKRLIAALGGKADAPYFYAFRRMLFWARK
jgi:trans-aconitate 2-methyltransferase